MARKGSELECHLGQVKGRQRCRSMQLCADSAGVKNSGGAQGADGDGGWKARGREREEENEREGVAE